MRDDDNLRAEMLRAMVRTVRMIMPFWTAALVALTVACDGGQGQGQVSGPETVPNDPAQPVGPVIEQPHGANVVVAIDASAVRQEIQGFGSSMRIFSDPHLIGESGGIEKALQVGSSDEAAILKTLYSELGLTRVRPVHQARNTQPTPGDIPRRDWVFADGHIDLVQRARAQGLQGWWLSPLALETWMNESNVPQYVEWALDVIRYWRSRGVELTWYSIVNEPSIPAVNLSGEFLRDAVKLLGRRLAAEGFTTRLVVPDDVNPLDGAPKARLILADPEARQYVAAIASHVYGQLPAMSEMAALSAEYNLPLWMSEYSIGDSSPMDWARLVHTLIVDYNVSAVDHMWGFFGDYETGTQLVALHRTGNRLNGYTITPSGYGMAQYARYVRPGARRIEAKSSDENVKVSAYMRGGKLTIVALNEGGSPQAVRFTVSGGGPLTALRLVRSSQTEKLRAVGQLTIEGTSFNVELAPKSISTLYQ